MGAHQSSPIETCLTAAVGGNGDLVAFPSKVLYQIQDVKPYNMDIDVHPVAVTYPKTADQVSEVIKCATAQAGYTVQARGGGHSYANYGKSCSQRCERNSKSGRDVDDLRRNTWIAFIAFTLPKSLSAYFTI